MQKNPPSPAAPSGDGSISELPPPAHIRAVTPGTAELSGDLVKQVPGLTPPAAPSGDGTPEAAPADGLLIDYLALRFYEADFSDELAAAVTRIGKRVYEVDPLTAESVLKYVKHTPLETFCADTAHSQSLTYGYNPETGYLEISGSPCRVMGLNNVFGSADIVASAQAMADYMAAALDAPFPAVEKATLHRLDLTYNYHLGNLGRVRSALKAFAFSSNRRAKCLNEYPDTVDINRRAQNRRGQVYAKGPQLRQAVRNAKAAASTEQLNAADGLLRLEVRLLSQGVKRWLAGRHWYTLEHRDLKGAHENFFNMVTPTAQVDTSQSELARIDAAAAALGYTPGMARAARQYLSHLRAVGLEAAEADTNPRTLRRHMRLLLAAGFTTAELHAAPSVQRLKFEPIVLGPPVRDWDELLRLHGAQKSG